jgi:hypothetical protein
MRREPEAPTLQTTAFVHEAWIRLAKQHSAEWRNRAQFYGEGCSSRMSTQVWSGPAGSVPRPSHHQHPVVRAVQQDRFVDLFHQFEPVLG